MEWILWIFLVPGILVSGGLLVALIIYFWLAPNNIFFTFVKEGTAKAVMRGDAFKKIIFQWEKHFMDDNWNIWREEGEEGAKGKTRRQQLQGQILGGLWFFGIWPIDRIYRYPLRWTDLRRVEEAEEKIEKPQFHDEKALDHVMLKPAVYWTKIFKIETCPPERIPVDIEILITMRIVNPYHFFFIAPPTPLEDVLARIDALMRSRVSMMTVDELLVVKSKSDVLWEGWEEIPGLKDEKLIKETLPKWGLKVAGKGVDIKNIGLPPDYQEAAAAERKQELITGGRAEAIMGTVVTAVAKAEGRKIEEVQAEFRQNPEKFYKRHKTLIDNTMTKLSMEERAYLRIETPGATGFGGEFLRLIGAWLRMPMGGKGEGEEPRETKKETKKEEEEEREMEDLTAEAEKEAKRLGF